MLSLGAAKNETDPRYARWGRSLFADLREFCAKKQCLSRSVAPAICASRRPCRADACPDPAFAVKVAASVRTAEEEDMTDGDKIAAAVMAASLCSKVNANPDEYVQNYFDILQKMSQQEGAAQQRRWNAPKG
jgi:hypothetical protein